MINRQIAKMILFMLVNFWFNNLFQQRWGQWQMAVAANDDLKRSKMVSKKENRLKLCLKRLE